MREPDSADRLLLLAVKDGDVVGSGIADRSDTAGAGFVAPRVLPGIVARVWGQRSCEPWPSTAAAGACPRSWRVSTMRGP